MEDLTNDFDFSKFYPQTVKALSWKGKIYAVPRDVSNLVIFYNKDIFDKYNVPYPNPNWTMQDFLIIAEKLTHRPNVFGISFEEEPLMFLPYLTNFGRGMAAAMMLGAEGVQMGTRFVVAKESIVHQNYKERIIKAKDIDSEVTGMSTGHPIRVLRNQMTRDYLKLEKEGASFEELEQLTLGSLRKAVIEGDAVHGSLMAGQSAGLVKKEQTCQEIIEEVVTDARALLAGRK